jgi:hypothetical protein
MMPMIPTKKEIAKKVKDYITFTKPIHDDEAVKVTGCSVNEVKKEVTCTIKVIDVANGDIVLDPWEQTIPFKKIGL